MRGLDGLIGCPEKENGKTDSCILDSFKPLL